MRSSWIRWRIGCTTACSNICSIVCGANFADCNRKYLSGPLGEREPLEPGYLSPQIELRGFEVIR